MSKEDIIKENEQRKANINTPYDPYTGTDGSVERFVFEIDDAPMQRQNIPITMQKEPIVIAIKKSGTLFKTAKNIFQNNKKKNSIEIWRAFTIIRCKHDFEFWAATQIKIVHKLTGQLVPFILNRAQRFYLNVLETLRIANVPIDIILLKSRQWGGSTLTQFYMLWIQLFWKKNWNSVICADVDDQAKGVLGMIDRAIQEYDTFITFGINIELKPYMRTDSTRILSEGKSTISVGSAQHPEKIRSQNISMAHLTEVGLWKKTLGKKPEDLAQAIFGSIYSAPYTIKIMESTAKGTGNYFHRTWLKAVNHKNNFTPVFIPWFMNDFYFETIENAAEFIATMTDDDKRLFELGATLEQIKWYNKKSKEFDDQWRMMSEFPSTATEAFQSTGHRFYDLKYIDELRKGVIDPIKVGEIIGDDTNGIEALNNLRFESTVTGFLHMWIDVDNTVDMSERYLVVVDIGGISSKADNSVICVFDRYWMHEAGGLPEVAAEWCGHIDHDLLAWKSAQIAKYYQNALLVVESNTLETEKTEGNHFNTILSEIAGVYDNMYRRTKAEQLVKGGEIKYGFHTNTSTKPMVCDFQKEVLRDGLYIEHCAEAVDEHETFEVKDNGKLEAVDGCHDDRHITRAIGNYFNYKVMSYPKFITKEETHTASRPIVSEYTM